MHTPWTYRPNPACQSLFKQTTAKDIVTASNARLVKALEFIDLDETYGDDKHARPSLKGE